MCHHPSDSSSTPRLSPLVVLWCQAHGDLCQRERRESSVPFVKEWISPVFLTLTSPVPNHPQIMFIFVLVWQHHFFKAYQDQALRARLVRLNFFQPPVKKACNTRSLSLFPLLPLLLAEDAMRRSTGPRPRQPTVVGVPSCHSILSLLLMEES